MRTRILVPCFLGLVLGFTAVPILALSTSDPGYRECMARAWADRNGAFLQATRVSHDEIEAALQEHASRYDAAWGIEHTRDRNRELSNIERAYRDRTRAGREAFRDTEREIRNIFRDAERACRNRPTSSSSHSSSSQQVGGTCSAERNRFEDTVAGNRSCSTDADCTLFSASCPLVTCGAAVRIDRLSTVRAASEDVANCLRASGAVPCAICQQQHVVCESGRCVAR